MNEFSTTSAICNGTCKDHSSISTCLLHTSYYSTGGKPLPTKSNHWVNGNVHFSSKTSEWETPQNLFDELNEEFDFLLDVCATKENSKCENYFTKEDDGLSKDWRKYSMKWMNPPYGREIGKWVKKASESGNTVALLPARTDTKWFHDYIYNKAEIRFLKGRLKFGGSKNSAPFPSMIVVFSSVL